MAGIMQLPAAGTMCQIAYNYPTCSPSNHGLPEGDMDEVQRRDAM